MVNERWEDFFQCISIWILLVGIFMAGVPGTVEAATFEIFERPLGDSGLRNGGVEWADVDLDDDLDLLVMGEESPGSPRLLKFINNGDGVFDFKKNLLTNDGIYDGDIAVANIDGDSGPDFTFMGKDSDGDSRLATYLNDGNGGYSLHQDILGTDSGLVDGGLVWSEFTGDTFPDLAATGSDSTGSERLMVFEGTGAGSVTLSRDPPQGPISGGLKKSSIGGAFINNKDGRELAVIGRDPSGRQRFVIYSNDGSGTFSSSNAEPAGVDNGFENGDIELVDFDSDGDSDVAVMGEDNDGDHRFILYENDTGGFTVFDEPMGKNDGLAYGAMDWADMDLDGDKDLAIIGKKKGPELRFKIMSNDGEGNLSTVDNPLGSDSGLWRGDVEWGNARSDTRPELVVMGENPSGDFRLLLFENTDSFGGGGGEDDTDEGINCIISRVHFSEENNIRLRALRDSVMSSRIGRIAVAGYYYISSIL